MARSVLSNGLSNGLTRADRWTAAVLSVLLFALFIGVWQLATAPAISATSGQSKAVDAEYAQLMGKSKSASGFPRPVDVGRAFVQHLSDPFYDRGPNDKGIGIQVAHSRAELRFGLGLRSFLRCPLVSRSVCHR